MHWGPQILEGGQVRFSLWAPDRETVSLEIDGLKPLAMQHSADGWFAVETFAMPGTRYRFQLAPDLVVPDPASRAQSGGVHGWSVLTDPAGYRWQTPDGRGRPWEESIIQEIHAGLAGGFSGVTARLPDLARLGITAIELMPIAAFSGTRGWGYDGVLPYAVHESYGSPEELKALIDSAHGAGLMVFLDVVYNHFGPDGNYIGAYASPFFDHHSDTPWGSAVAVSREPVRRFFIENALMWLGEYRFDGLRFDAVHAIADDQFLDAMAREIRQAFPDRHVHLVLENEANDPDRLAPGLFDAQWNDDFHNVLHVLLTGEREGYYKAFVENPTEKLARCLAEGFVYQGEKGRGKPSGHLAAARFIAFLQNHDQIGNRALGERLPLLSSRENLRAATALLFLCPQIPLFFMGDEKGSRSPFLFFTDFHDDLADAVREGRRREFACFAHFTDPSARERIPDPNAAETFEQSHPMPGPDAAEWRAFYREMIALRQQHIVPRLTETRGMGAEVLAEGAVAARWVMYDGARLMLALNIGRETVVFPEEGELLFAEGAPGQPGSFVARLSL